MIEPKIRFTDNPLMLAQTRLRLRPRELRITLMISIILAVCAVLQAIAIGGQSGFSTATSGLIGLGAFVLFAVGGAKVTTAVARDRQSGILDFHRAAPTTPWTDGLGYVIGSASREYLVFALLCGVGILLSVPSSLSTIAVIATVLILLVSGLTYNLLGAVAGLYGDGKRAQFGLLAILVPLALAAPWAAKGGFVTLIHLTPLPAIASLGLSDSLEHFQMSIQFFGVPIPSVLYTFVVHSFVALFAALAIVRRLERDHRRILSRLEALFLFGCGVMLTIGSDSTSETSVLGSVEALPAYLLLAAVMGSVVMIAMAPTYLDFVRADRRGLRKAEPVPWHSDGAIILPFTASICALVVAGFSVLSLIGNGFEQAFSLVGVTTLVASLVAIFFAAAAGEYVRLNLRTNAKSGIMLIGFLWFILPWILAGIAGVASMSTLSIYLLAFSPAYGVVHAAMFMVESQTTSLAELDAAIVSIACTAISAYVMFYKVRSVRSEVSNNYKLQVAETAPSE